MTLDLVILRPEFFFLFGFLVLLWYGTGGLVTPVAENITVAGPGTNVPGSVNQGPQTYSQGYGVAVSGPSHAASA
jgi:hypothetical protein